MNAPSTFVSALLTTIANSDRGDTEALELLVRRIAAGPNPPWFALPTPDDTLYSLTKRDFADFIRISGLERWYGSTFLSVGVDGSVKSDVAPDARWRRTDKAVADLAASTVLQMQALGAKSTFVEGAECFIFRESGLVSILGVARQTACRSDAWQHEAALQDLPTPTIPEAPAPAARKRNRP